MASYKNSSSMDADAAARDENGAALQSTGAAAAALPQNDASARDAAKNNLGAAYQYHYFGAPTTDTVGQDEHGAAYAYVFSDARTAAHRRNDAAAAAYLYHPGARDATKHDDGGAAYQHHYSGAPTTEGQDEHAAAYAFSSARAATTLIDGGAADLFPDARTAAPAKNGAPYMFSDVHVPTAADTKDEDAACLYPSVHVDAASQVKNGAPVIFSDVRVPGFAAGRGEMLPYQTQMTAAAVKPPAAGYYNSGVLAVEALPLTSKVFGAKTTSVPAVAVAVAQDKVAGAFTERLRRGLPVLGLSLASLAVTGLAAGEPTTATGFGLFLMLIVGLSTVPIRALRD